MTIEKVIDAHTLLTAAGGHMNARASTYDKPEGERSMALTVEVFNTFHGTQLTEAQGWHFMQVLKDVRLFTRSTFHQDSAEDGIAYAALKGEAKAREMPAIENIPHIVQSSNDGIRGSDWTEHLAQAETICPVPMVHHAIDLKLADGTLGYCMEPTKLDWSDKPIAAKRIVSWRYSR